jgi:hypothetical protein
VVSGIAIAVPQKIFNYFKYLKQNGGRIGPPHRVLYAVDRQFLPVTS